MGYIRDLGCPLYCESQVVQFELVDRPWRFRSCINGILVHEVRCLEDPPNVEYLYGIRVLHCMQGTSGFARLVGAVTDDDSKDLKAYLIEYPKSHHNVMQLVGDPAISWERREKWAFQIIRGVSRIHQQSLVVGGLTIFTIPLIMDNTDSVLFWLFRERITPGRTVGAYYPPEFCFLRDASPSMDVKNRPCVTSKMDIFHLGLLLWLLAEGNPMTRPSPVCMRQNCSTRGEDACDLSHHKPDTLPTLPESVPKYYRNIVDECGAKNPGDRPAARDLLVKFPAVSDTVSQSQEAWKQSEVEATLNAECLHISKVACSLCWNRPAYLKFPLFYCNICHRGDFDLCHACFLGGKHCDDKEHLLVEMGKVGNMIAPRRYHSCVKSSGVREIIDV